MTSHYTIAKNEDDLWPSKIEDEFVTLELMQAEHVAGLYAAGQYDEIWQWTTAPYCLTAESTLDWVNLCMDQYTIRAQIPYVIIDKRKQCIIGSTSYLNISIPNKCLEIGFTFLSPSAQKTSINRRCKLMLLSYAFETLQCNRVALQTHEKNSKSRNAIEGIGAKYEGTMRNCRIQHNGDIRSSVVYSIIALEWPTVKTMLSENIKKRLARSTKGS